MRTRRVKVMNPPANSQPDHVQRIVPGNKRLYDLVVWGASGFVGRLVVEYLLQRHPPGGALRWAVAGRDQKKLALVLDKLTSTGERPPIVIAESHDPDSLNRLTRDAKVVLTTVGPYASHGSGLVKACVTEGTDYCDLCGEVEWVRAMIDRHQPEAQQSGARIVMSCGFDSIPSDIGVNFLQEQAMATYGQPCQEIAMLVRAMRGGVSGGTVASMLNSVGKAKQDNETGRLMMDPYALNPEGERDGADQPNQTGSLFDTDAGEWTAPFVMAAMNTKVVRRTNALLGYPYGRDFRYKESIMTGKGVGGRCKSGMISIGLRLFMLASSNPFTRRVARKLAPKPGEGPSRQKRESGYFDLLFIGKQPDGTKLRLGVKGDRDPGYGSTSRMITESAVCLASDRLETSGGFWTPASAMGNALRKRLITNAGLTFNLE